EKDLKKVNASKTAEPAASAAEPVVEATLETANSDKDVRAEERTRFDTVMSSEAAQGRTKSAQSLITKTDMSADDIITMLGDMPAEAKGASKLDVAMGAEDQPGIGADAGGDAVDQEEVATVNAIAGGIQKHNK
ncbi:MAG: hypothetical protein OEX07_09630, partial [Gammaproteobacteria bacterium]|nr:hypothetical protein [Gammaproteobacteria bacterium]